MAACHGPHQYNDSDKVYYIVYGDKSFVILSRAKNLLCTIVVFNIQLVSLLQGMC